MKLRNNQNGTTHIVVAVLVALALVAGVGVLTYHRQQTGSQSHAAPVAPQASTTTKLPADDAKETKTAPLSDDTTQPATGSTPTAKTKTTTPAPTSTTTVMTSGISISNDGCQVTVNGTTGNAFSVDTYTPHKGGTGHYHIPASGTATVTTGGIKDMTVFVQLFDAGGNVTLSKYGTITVDSCSAASAES